MSDWKNQILIMGHRGASAVVPENTLKAFEKAIELKADYIEFDVQETVDGELVITHDEDIKRITGQDGIISKMTLNELRMLDFGESEKIPTLEELVKLTKNRIKLNCEIKTKGITEKVIKIFRKWGILDTSMVSSFIHEELLEIQKLESSIKLASLEPTPGTIKIDWSKKKEMIEYCINNKLYAINPIVMMVDQQFIDYAHANDIKVFPWTVDSRVGIKKLIRLGADGIITNDITKVKDILRSFS
ncbi:MAG: glycerophosphodiester phosphodiesterase [Promethearchaeota archaeon]